MKVKINDFESFFILKKERNTNKLYFDEDVEDFSEWIDNIPFENAVGFNRDEVKEDAQLRLAVSDRLKEINVFQGNVMKKNKFIQC